MNNTYPLPASCKEAVPYFELSDTLREFAIYHTDLIAAFYIRKKALYICQDISKTLSGREKEYVCYVLNELINQLQELKEKYEPTNEIGLQILREKCLSSYFACIQHDCLGTIAIPSESAFLYNQVILYLNTIELLSPLSEEEKRLRKYCKHKVVKQLGSSVDTILIKSRLDHSGIQEEPVSFCPDFIASSNEEEEDTPTEAVEMDQPPLEPAESVTSLPPPVQAGEEIPVPSLFLDCVLNQPQEESNEKQLEKWIGSALQLIDTMPESERTERIGELESLLQKAHACVLQMNLYECLLNKQQYLIHYDLNVP